MFVDEKKFESCFSDRLTFSNIRRRTSRRIYRLALPLRAPETLSSLGVNQGFPYLMRTLLYVHPVQESFLALVRQKFGILAVKLPGCIPIKLRPLQFSTPPIQFRTVSPRHNNGSSVFHSSSSEINKKASLWYSN